MTMDVDIEELRNLLFGNDAGLFDDGNEDFSTYITNLASCGVENLSREGVYLMEEKNGVLAQTLELVYSNYKTFIHTADCSHAVFDEFNDVENRFVPTQNDLIELKEKAEKFVGTSRNLTQARCNASMILNKHAQLLEILELPQLMDTCVRNSYYDDSLEILAYVQRIERKHLNIPIIDEIISEVKGGTRLMLLQLIMELRSPLTLPQSLKVVGFLRRLKIFSEVELRLKFIQARDSWFSGLIKAVPKDDAYQHISKVIELSRNNLFDIITQYRAIFSDDDITLSITEAEIDLQNIFYGWIIHKINEFLSILEKDLSEGIGCNLEAIMAQCMYFGQSFSRIEADFRNLLNPIFQKATLTQFENDVRHSNYAFDESWSSFLLGGDAPSTPFLTEELDKTIPPLSLMEFLPLVHYLNGLVSAFNGLRQCCQLALLGRVVTILSSSVSKVVAAVVDLHQLESSGFTAGEEKCFGRLCYVISLALIPHINSCLRLLFSLESLSKACGISPTSLQKLNVGQLDVGKLTRPIAHFISEETLVSRDVKSDTVEATVELSDVSAITNKNECVDDSASATNVNTLSLGEKAENTTVIEVTPTPSVD